MSTKMILSFLMFAACSSESVTTFQGPDPVEDAGTGGSSATTSQPSSTGGRTAMSTLAPTTGGQLGTGGTSAVSSQPLATGGQTAISSQQPATGGQLATGGTSAQAGSSQLATGGRSATGGYPGTGGSQPDDACNCPKRSTNACADTVYQCWSSSTGIAGQPDGHGGTFICVSSVKMCGATNTALGSVLCYGC
jgi:hypothetical protein